MELEMKTPHANCSCNFFLLSQWSYSEFLVEESSFDTGQSILEESLNSGNETFTCTNQQASISIQSLGW